LNRNWRKSRRGKIEREEEDENSSIKTEHNRGTIATVVIASSLAK